MPGRPEYIVPDWPAPAGVTALSTLRRGGRSAAPFDSFNLAHHVGDAPDAVAANRRVLRDELPGQPAIAWLDQVHGRAVVEAQRAGEDPEADAVFTRRPGIACAVMTADCLPVLLCADNGAVVAAAHAGWRGLLAGVLEATVAALAEPPARILAWLGPAIGPDAFEVGPEVREQFFAAMPGEARAPTSAVSACFRPSPARAGHYLADLPALARLRLAGCGVSRVYGGQWCTFSDPQRFYSYRRDGRTGRMASVICLVPDHAERAEPGTGERRN